MKSVLASIAAAAMAFYFIISGYPPYNLTTIFPRLLIVFFLLALLLSLSLLPWLNGNLSDKWRTALRYGILLTFCVFDIGYLTFALSTFI
jgi:hypothetical protein